MKDFKQYFIVGKWFEIQIHFQISSNKLSVIKVDKNETTDSVTRQQLCTQAKGGARTRLKLSWCQPVIGCCWHCSGKSPWKPLWPLYPWLILGLRPTNERWRYFVMPSLIGWAQSLESQSALIPHSEPQVMPAKRKRCPSVVFDPQNSGCWFDWSFLTGSSCDSRCHRLPACWQIRFVTPRSGDHSEEKIT